MSTVKIEIYRDAAQQYRWRYRAANGKIQADSGEAYAERNDAVEAALQVFDLQIKDYLATARDMKIAAGQAAQQAADDVAEWPQSPYQRRRLFYFFDRRWTGRSHDVELVEVGVPSRPAEPSAASREGLETLIYTRDMESAWEWVPTDAQGPYRLIVGGSAFAEGLRHAGFKRVVVTPDVDEKTRQVIRGNELKSAGPAVEWL